MTKIKYTLDRFDDFFGVFLLRSDESQQLLIPKNLISIPLTEGDIVEIHKTDNDYEITLLNEETADMKEKVSSLLEKLLNQNN